jgi:16S rRNA (cytidine1402-2'-O)-methyltransferase
VPAIDIVRKLRDFVAENPKSSRAFLSALGMPVALRELNIGRLDEHTRAQDIPALLAPLRAGRSLGLLSEAGCPGVADPGAALVDLAHREAFRVTPLVGPCSILLALMASGLEGQRFAFCGYLPRERAQRAQRIRELEIRSRVGRETEIFIETPYRNQALLAALLEVCRPDTRICVASDLTLPGESIALYGVAEWRKRPLELAGKPSVFLLQAA